MRNLDVGHSRNRRLRAAQAERALAERLKSVPIQLDRDIVASVPPSASATEPARTPRKPTLVEIATATVARHARGCRCIACKPTARDGDGAVRVLVPKSKVPRTPKRRNDQAVAKKLRELEAAALGANSGMTHAQIEAAIRKLLRIAAKQGRPFTGADVREDNVANQALFDTAFGFLDEYDGADEYIRQFQEVADDTGELTGRQCARVLNAIVRLRRAK